MTSLHNYWDFIAHYVDKTIPFICTGLWVQPMLDLEDRYLILYNANYCRYTLKNVNLTFQPNYINKEIRVKASLTRFFAPGRLIKKPGAKNLVRLSL